MRQRKKKKDGVYMSLYMSQDLYNYLNTVAGGEMGTTKTAVVETIIRRHIDNEKRRSRRREKGAKIAPDDGANC